MNCPVCTEPLKPMERQNIEIDYCPKCRGVWLDRGELDKIIERTAGESRTPTPDEKRRFPSNHRDDDSYDDDSDHGFKQHRGKPYRKESFLSKLFDWD